MFLCLLALLHSSLPADLGGANVCCSCSDPERPRNVRNRVDEEPEDEEAEPDFEDEAAAEEYRQRKVRCEDVRVHTVAVTCSGNYPERRLLHGKSLLCCAVLRGGSRAVPSCRLAGLGGRARKLAALAVFHAVWRCRHSPCLLWTGAGRCRLDLDLIFTMTGRHMQRNTWPVHGSRSHQAL